VRKRDWTFGVLALISAAFVYDCEETAENYDPLHGGLD